MKSEALQEVAKASPPLAVGGLTLFGIPLNEWVLLLSLLYTLFLIIDKSPTVIERLRSFGRWVKEKLK